MDIKTSFDTYEDLVCRPVNINAIKKSIEIIRNSNIDYEFRTTLIKGFHSESIIQELLELKLNNYNFQQYNPRTVLDRERCNDFSTFTKEELIELSFS